MRPLRRAWARIALMVLVLVGAQAHAHKPSDSYLTLRADPGGAITARWDIALRDLDYVLHLDANDDGALTWGEVRSREADITTHATAHLSVRTPDGIACPLKPAEPMQLDRHTDGTYAVLNLAGACASPTAGALTLRYTLLFDVDPSHRGLLQWLPPGAASAQARVFAADSAEQTLDLEAPSPWQTLRQYLLDGVWHIWIGYDHILFLLALLLPAVLVRGDGARWHGAPRFRGALVEVLKVVTAFTVAHSITLSLAALGLISLPSRWVESAIAASVVVAALNNLRGGEKGRRWLMAFAFGLIHGFGFASVLADLGLPRGALALALVGFNAGVELGQLAIVAAFLPLAFKLRHTRFYQTGVFRFGSVVVACVAAWWFVQRAFDL